MPHIEICNLKPETGPAREDILISCQESLFICHRAAGNEKSRPARCETKILLRKYETQEASDLVRSSVLDQSGHDGRSVNRGKDINGRVASKDRGWRGSTTAFAKFSHFRRGRQFYHDWL